ncbi:hypothetical protein AALA79_01785 [Lachnospiraceae bacterium 64-25]
MKAWILSVLNIVYKKRYCQTNNRHAVLPEPMSCLDTKIFFDRFRSFRERKTVYDK